MTTTRPSPVLEATPPLPQSPVPSPTLHELSERLRAWSLRYRQTIASWSTGSSPSNSANSEISHTTPAVP